MILTLLIISLIGYKLFFQTVWGNQKSFSELYSNSLIILILLGFGLADKLSMGPKVVLVIGLIFFLISIFRIKQKRMNPLALNLHWDILIYLGLFGLFYLKNIGAYLNSWDEFSYWGLVDKEIFTFNSLPKPHFLTTFKDYPPGQALYHYFFTNLLGFNEGILYFAQAMLLVTPLLGLIRQFDAKKWQTILLLMILINFNIFIFSNGIQTLLIDTIVSVYFALFLIMFFLEIPNEKASIKIPFLIALASFPILKQIGFVLSLIAIVTWIIVKFLNHTKITRKEIIFSLASIFSISLTKFIWDKYVQTQGFVLSVRSDQMSFVNYAKDLWLQNKLVVTVTKNFFKAFIDTASAYSFWLKIDSINFLWIFLLIALITVLSYYQYKERKFLWWQLMIFLGFIGFAAIHILVYCYGVGEFTGVNVSSFARYMNIYILAWMIFIVFYFIYLSPDFFDKYKNRLKYKIALFMTLFLMAPRGALTYAIPRSSKEPYTPERLMAIEAANKTRQYIADGNSKILYTFQRSRGHEVNMTVYELYPLRNYSGCYSYGKPYYPGDVWTCDITDEQMTSALLDVDYFYVHNPDSNLCQTYVKIFGKDCMDTHLYRISKTDKKLNLSKVF